MSLIFVVILIRTQFKDRFSLKDVLRFDFSIMKKIIRYGVPTGIEFFLIFFAFSTFVALFHSYGIHEALAMTITFNWDILAFYPVWGINIGLMSIVGRYLGAKNQSLALRSTYSGAKMVFSLTSLFTLIVWFLAEPMVAMFIPESIGQDYDKVLYLGVSMLKLLVVYFWGTAINLVYSATLRAAGDTRFCMYISILGDLTMLVATYMAIRNWHFDPLLTWSIYVGFIFAIGLLFALRFYSGKWKTMKLI